MKALQVAFIHSIDGTVPCLFSFPLKQWYIFFYAKSLFDLHLAEYLLFCNTKRIHKSLGKMTPPDYLIQKDGTSHFVWNFYSQLTFSLKSVCFSYKEVTT